MPVRVSLTSTDSWSGVLTLRYSQDSTQQMVVRVPVSTTPGKVVPFELPACLPRNLNEVRLELTNSDTRIRHDLVQFSGQGITALPMITDGVRILVVGDSGATSSLVTELNLPSGFEIGNSTVDAQPDSGAVDDSPSPDADEPGTDSPVPDGTVPDEPTPGQAVPADATEGQQPEGDSSGSSRTTVVAAPVPPLIDTNVIVPPIVPMNAKSDEPDVWSTASIDTTHPTKLPLDWACFEQCDVVIAKASTLDTLDPRRKQSLRTWIRAGGRLVLEADQGGSLWRQWVDEQSPIDLLDPAMINVPPHTTAVLTGPKTRLSPTRATISGRAISLTPAGKNTGWKLIWPLGTDDTVAFAAMGPCGMGMVTVHGAQIGSIPAMPNNISEKALWKDLLGHPTWGILHSSLQYRHDGYGYGWGGSGSDTVAQQSLQSSLDGIAIEQPVGIGAVFVIIFSSGLLALALGPIDRIRLKRAGKLHQSWMWAIGWIVLGTSAALIAPALIRSGKSSLSRLVIQDVLCDADAGVATWQTSVNGFFAGRRGWLELSDPAAGAWWRGVSSLSMYSDSAGSLSNLTASPTTVEPGSPRSLVPGAFAMSQWTYRTLVSQSCEEPAAGAPFARVRLENDGYHIDVFNLPKDAEIVNTAMDTAAGGVAATLTPVPDRPGRWTGVGTRASTALNVWGTPKPASDTNHWYFQRSDSAVESVSPNRVLGISHARDRLASIKAYVQSGEYACVYIAFTTKDAGVGFSGFEDVDTRTHQIVRMLCPLPGGTGSP